MGVRPLYAYPWLNPGLTRLGVACQSEGWIPSIKGFNSDDEVPGIAIVKCYRWCSPIAYSRRLAPPNYLPKVAPARILFRETLPYYVITALASLSQLTPKIGIRTTFQAVQPI